MRVELGDASRTFRVVWALAWPLRAYVRHTPIARGRWFLIRRLSGLLPSEGACIARVPGGGRIRVGYREIIGQALLLGGSFEDAEVETLRSFAAPGTVAVDAGANVGVFTIPLAHAVGVDGVVWAFEPLSENVDRLEANVRENHLENVRVVAAAVSDRDGTVRFNVADDSAYGSTGDVFHGREMLKSVIVPARRLDAEWTACGKPRVSVIKIDVEGGELSVLRGAEDVIRHCRPILLVEAAGRDELAEIERYLSTLEYRRNPSERFARHNHLFVPT